MAKISSKFLNMEGLQQLIESSKNTSDFNGAMIMTSFAMIVGKLKPVYSETDMPHAAELVYDYKESYVSAMEGPVEIIGDGSLLVIEDAVIINGTNKIEIDEFTVHCADVIGFTPVNVEKFLQSLN